MSTGVPIVFDDLPELSAKEARFALLYVFDPHTKGNAAASARKAGYAAKSARSSGYKMLRKRHIEARVEQHTAELTESTKVSATNVLERYRQIAMADPISLLIEGDNGLWRFRTPSELPTELRALVADVSIRNVVDRATGQVVEQVFTYRTHNVKDALDSLARTQGMFRDRVEHEHTGKVRALFEFVARVPERSETVAMLDAKHGRGKTIEGEAVTIPSPGHQPGEPGP